MKSETALESSDADLEKRLVRYSDLVPCYNAFVDTRTPGSEAKENFTIIGPGVSENPDQYVHIAEPHGFNVGGARQPPGCVNSQHSHKTAEVFVVHKGTWRFDFGEDGQDAQVTLNEGDVVSIPTGIFRGFTNVGDGSGYLYAILGEDDPGRVTWAPAVFELAKEHGLVLLESGMLIDTVKGEEVPADARPMQPPSKNELAAMARIDNSEAQNYVWRASGQAESTVHLVGENGVFAWDHGFTFERKTLTPTSHQDRDAPTSPEVLFLQEGEVHLGSELGEITMKKGDTFSAPQGLAYSLRCLSDKAICFIAARQES